MKLHRISTFDRELLLTFFDPLTFSIAVEALIEKSSKGALWLDDRYNPSLGIFWNFADGVYLVSKGVTDSMEESLHTLFQEEIIPEAVKRTDSPVFVIYCSPERWEPKIRTIFSQKWSVSPEMACFYERPSMVSTSIPQPKMLSKEFTEQLIDQELFHRTDLKYWADLMEEVESDWGSVGTFLREGFGYCVINRNMNSLASWAVIGNLARSCAELGIDTMEQYQRQGIATNIAYQIIALSYRKNLTPHWYCFQRNIASVKLAEKLGFRKIQDFLVFVVEQKREL